MGEAGRDWYRTFFGDTWNLRVALPIPEEQTREEVDFIINTLKLEEGARVLDLACGHGRHSLELARRGFSMVGVDLSEEPLRIARRNAERAGVTVDYRLADMREIDVHEDVDAVINMFTAFGYLESQEEDQRVLDRVAAALRPGGRFLIDTINFLWLIRNFRPDRWHDYDDGTVLLESRRYDLPTGRTRSPGASFIRMDRPKNFTGLSGCTRSWSLPPCWTTPAFRSSRLSAVPTAPNTAWIRVG
ncbi:MAG: SAM-dependent methyltransferase [Actinomycetota bacterium]